MKNDDFDDNETENSASDDNERLLKVNEHLRSQLLAAQQQLASLSALSTSLMQRQQQQPAGDALVAVGQGVDKRYLNARSIRMLSLQEGMVLNTHDTPYA